MAAALPEAAPTARDGQLGAGCPGEPPRRRSRFPRPDAPPGHGPAGSLPRRGARRMARRGFGLRDAGGPREGLAAAPVRLPAVGPLGARYPTARHPGRCRLGLFRTMLRTLGVRPGPAPLRFLRYDGPTGIPSRV